MSKHPKYKHIKSLNIIEQSGFNPKPGCIKSAKKNHYCIVKGFTITGDAPKDFIRYYKYGIGKKGNINNWPLYIAKLGHKHYPVESITEFLLNRIGEVFGYNMAKSRLGWFGGQIRFLSEYFLNKPSEQQLEHGAELYAGYLNDKEFVEEIEEQRLSQDLFTIQFTQETLKHFFPNNREKLFAEFINMLIYDALIGNNDRHFYNWAIVRNVYNKDEFSFAPIYDTARGLFWNDHEDKIKRIYKNKNELESYIEKYSEKSKPKIGWEGKTQINHFQLLECMQLLPVKLDCNNMSQICSNHLLDEVLKMIEVEFKELLSYERRCLIKECLKYRHARIKKIFNFAS